MRQTCGHKTNNLAHSCLVAIARTCRVTARSATDTLPTTLPDDLQGVPSEDLQAKLAEILIAEFGARPKAA
jgi:hypothetical protein